MDKEEYEWKDKGLRDKANDVFEDDETTCFIVSTGYKDTEGLVGNLEIGGEERDVLMLLFHMIVSIAKKVSARQGNFTESVIRAMCETAIKILKEEDK